MPVFGIFPSSGGGNTLKSIAISTPPTKTSYTAGDQFDPAGMVLEATYEDDSVAQVTGFYYNPAGELTADVNQITVLYSEGGVLLTAVQPISVSNAVGIALPSQSGTLTYNGSGQAPTWSGFDSTKMIIGGITTAINAGTYPVTFTPRDGYEWGDGTKDAKIATWSIGRAAGSMSLSSEEVELVTGHTSEQIEVTRTGDGVISVHSSNETVATASVVGNIISIYGAQGGDAVITVDVGTGTNHESIDGVDVQVVCDFGATASITPTEGVEYVHGVSDLPPDQINTIARAISNCADITSDTNDIYFDYGNLHRSISVGDQVVIPLDSVDYQFDVIGFNHDVVTIPSVYGSVTSTGKAGITFQMHYLYQSLFYMNNLNISDGGWELSNMRMSTMSAAKGWMPTEWQDVVKSVSKKSGIGGSSTEGTQTTQDYCFLLSEVEITGNDAYSVSDQGTRYKYYNNGVSAAKLIEDGSFGEWYTRSAVSGSTGYFINITTSGSCRSCYAGNQLYLSFAFCV